MHRKIAGCRVCGNKELLPILSLGTPALTGVFPKERGEKVTRAPLELVKCAEDPSGERCGLVQLRHSFDPAELYGGSYGYRSGLNRSMVEHLRAKAGRIMSRVTPGPGDVVLDIGSNDGTLLRAYPESGPSLIGMDPTGAKFREFYPGHVRLVPEFFSAAGFLKAAEGRKAKVITSIAMLYDLESPVDFFREVHGILADDGIWVFEQSYLPAMLRVNAYDTICHEHLEYYGLRQIRWIMERTGFKIVEVELNDVNGGSFSVTAAKREAPYAQAEGPVSGLLRSEARLGLGTLRPYRAFKARVEAHRGALRSFLDRERKGGRKMLGYGASTKGNVILQYCGITEKDLPYIAEVNQDKFGRFTPGTRIPIIPEEEARAMAPDYFLVLPWHFKEGIVEREMDFIARGGRLAFPLPEISVFPRGRS